MLEFVKRTNTTNLAPASGNVSLGVESAETVWPNRGPGAGGGELTSDKSEINREVVSRRELTGAGGSERYKFIGKLGFGTVANEVVRNLVVDI